MSSDSDQAEEILGLIDQAAVIPVVTISTDVDPVHLVDALSAGGIDVIEITFRTPLAAEAIRRIRAERPHCLVGAGTLTSVATVGLAARADAQFGLAPGLSPEVVRAAADASIPMIPGVQTPSEVERALTLGLRVVKFFPAESAGGVPTIRALVAAFGHLGVRFLPTGGIDDGNAIHYWAVPEVIAVGGSWLTASPTQSPTSRSPVTQRAEAARADWVQARAKTAGIANDQS